MQVASRYAGVVGVPALFGERVFRRLLELSGDVGASSLLRDELATTSIEWPEGEIDIDTARDLAKLFDDRGQPHGGGDDSSRFDALREPIAE
jgi:CTP:molybdopterin cytidylyltransferase MocA